VGKVAKPPGRDRQIRFEQAGEFPDGFVVKTTASNCSALSVAWRRQNWMALAGTSGSFFLRVKRFFLGRADIPAVPHQGGGGIMVVGRNAQDDARLGHVQRNG